MGEELVFVPFNHSFCCPMYHIFTPQIGTFGALKQLYFTPRFRSFWGIFVPYFAPQTGEFLSIFALHFRTPILGLFSASAYHFYAQIGVSAYHILRSKLVKLGIKDPLFSPQFGVFCVILQMSNFSSPCRFAPKTTKNPLLKEGFLMCKITPKNMQKIQSGGVSHNFTASFCVFCTLFSDCLTNLN